MKKVFVLFTFAAALFITSCGGGKPDLKDANAVAKYTCDKMKEMMGYMSDPEGNKSAIEALAKEMEEMEEEIEQIHKDGEKEFEDKVEAELKKVCGDVAGSF